MGFVFIKCFLYNLTLIKSTCTFNETMKHLFEQTNLFKQPKRVPTCLLTRCLQLWLLLQQRDSLLASLRWKRGKQWRYWREIVLSFKWWMRGGEFFQWIWAHGCKKALCKLLGDFNRSTIKGRHLILTCCYLIPKVFLSTSLLILTYDIKALIVQASH